VAEDPAAVRDRADRPARAPGWQQLSRHFPTRTSAATTQPPRDHLVDLDRIADSCGYAAPVMSLVAVRDVLARTDRRKSARELTAYRRENNAVSIDGLPALAARPAAGSSGR
jgi:hypothetical protein